MKGNLEWTEIVGLTLICTAICVLLACTLLMRVLAHLKLGRATVTLRTWFFISAILEQLAFLSFHIKYYTVSNFGDTWTHCTVLRFLMTLTSTFTMMWLLIISAYYYTLTVKPAKCFTFSCRFLSQCVAWTWTGVSGLIYLVLAFLMRADQHQEYIKFCWNNISYTVHLYFACGTDFLVFVCIVVCVAATRYRLAFKSTGLARHMQHTEYRDELTSLRYHVNLLTGTVVFLLMYYIAIVIRHNVIVPGSDIYLMAVQAIKGFTFALFMGILERNVRSLLKCGVELKHVDTITNEQVAMDFGPESSVKCNGFELEAIYHET